MTTTSKIIRPKQLSEQLGVNPVTIWRWTKNSTLPKPIKLGKRLIGWTPESIEQFLNQSDE
jgi:predicted DNA-binding transcriptional regulator AlpA